MELILNTYGVTLSKDSDGFVITNTDGKQKIPVSHVNSIQIYKGATITSDAILLAIENEIEIVFASRDGHPKGRIWSANYGSISTIRKGQINFTFSKDAVAWIKKVIMKKIDNQQALIYAFASDTDISNNIINKSINRLEDYKTKISLLDGEVISDISATLRGWEGVSSKIYFEAMNYYLPEHLRFESRSQHPAMNAANALLNYGYGILYGKIEGALIKSGIDPYVGIMHRDNYNRPVLVYDIIELYRIWVDYVVYNLLCQNAITEEYYSVKEDGSYWLEPLGRRVLIQSLNDYLEEVVEIKGNARKRITQIQLYTQELAQKFKKYEHA